MNSFVFSVVMAVHNVRDYLDEALESLVRQSFGLERVQIILADDGSTDGSGGICDRWQQKYPGNISVIHQANGGVSSARNAGLSAAAGKIINFMDADDRMGQETLQAVFRFFETHGDETDAAAVPVWFFEGAEGEHWLNRKFDAGTRVIDLTAEYQTQLLMVNSAFFRAEAVRDLRFDERLTNSEDLKFAAQAMMRKQKLGVVQEGRYWYRRRLAQNSALNLQTRKKDWYANTLRHAGLDLFDWAEETRGQIPLWLQYTILCDLKWRAAMDYQKDMEEVLSPEEQEEYRESLQAVLSRIEDRVFAEAPERMLEWPWKRWLLLRKNPDAQPLLKTENSGLVYYIGSVPVMELSSRPAEIREIRAEGEALRVTGLFRLPPGMDGKKIRLFLQADAAQRIKADPAFSEKDSVVRFGECTEAAWTFTASVRLAKDHESVWKIAVQPDEAEPVFLKCLVPGGALPVSPLSSELGRTGKWKFILTPEAVHLIPMHSIRARALSDLRLIRDLIRAGKSGRLKELSKKKRGRGTME